MLNLSELTFKVNTDALVQAAEKIAALGKSVEGLQGSFSKLEKGAAASEKALAEANRKNAQAAKANAEAALLQAKALTEVERAENLKVKTIQASTKATEESTRSVSSNVSMLQRQQDIYGFMIEGFSRGQSSILATAKAAGILADEMKTLKTVLQDQRALLSDPFDKSLSGLLSLKNELAVVTRVQSMYTAELGLTKKQMRELAVDEMRLTTMLKEQGKSTQEIDAALKKLNQEYIKTAGNVNQVLTAEQALERQRKETADANNAIEREMQRVNYALQTQNNELNKGTANALFRFEQNLKRSGLTLAEQKKKLDEYRTSLLALEKAKGSTQTDYISRALGPQITDIFVGLATGQNPLTVMLQQGGQLRDQFALAGVAAGDMGDTMRRAAKDMVVSVAAVAGAFKDLLVGAFIDTGKGITSLIGNVTGLSSVLEWARYQLTLLSFQHQELKPLLAAFEKLGTVLRASVGVAAGLAVASVVALGVAAYQTMKEQDKLAESLALYNGTLAISHSTAIEYVSTLNTLGVTTGNASAAIMQMAKAGVFASEDILLVAKAAADLADYSSVSVEDTIKVFAKLKEKPVEALFEVAKQTGMVSLETIKMVEELQKAGKQSEASALAMQTYGDVTAQQVTKMKENYSSFGLFVMELGKTIKNFFSDTFKSIFYESTNSLQKQADKLQAQIDSWEQASSVERLARGDAFGYTNDANKYRLQQLKDKIALMHLENTVFEEKIETQSKDAKNQEAVNKLMADANQIIDKATAKTLTLNEYVKKSVEEKTKNVQVSKEELAVLKQAAEVEWKALQKKDRTKKDPTENYYATLLRDSTNATIKADKATQDLTKSQLKMLEVINDPRFAKLSEYEQTNVLRNYAVAASNEKIAEGQELINKLLGKGEGLGKEYYATLAKLESLRGNAGIDQEQLEKALQALRDTTPEARRVQAEIKAAAEAYNQYSANAIASLESTKLGNQQLDYRLSVLGKSTEEQRKMKIQQDASVKLMQAEVKYAKEVLKIRQDTKLQNDPMLMAKALQDAETAYAEERKLINREVAVEAAEDFQKEFDRISGGVTDSIVTALFEGGKAGSKKFRDLVVAELRKPVTMVVSAVVNTVLGSIVGSLMGGATASTAGSAGGSILGSLGGSVLTSAGSSLLGLSAFTAGLGNIGTGVSLGLGLGSSTAAASAAAAAGGATTSAGLLSGIGNAIAAVPVWGWIAAGLAAIATMLDDSGTYHTGGAARYSKGGGLSSGNSGAAFDIGFGQVETGKETISAMEALSKSLVDIFDGIAKTFGKAAGYEVAVAFADDTSDDGAWGAFGVKLQGVEILNWDDFRQSKWAPKEFGDGEEGYKQYLAAIAKDTRQVILDMDLPSWADQVLNDIGDAPSLESLSKAIQELSQMKAMYDLMTSQMVNFAGITDDAFGKLIKEFGDIGTLTNQVTQYYQNYYSEFERFNKAQADVTKSFTDLGLTMPTSREEFRKLAESQDLNTEAGRKMYAQLMALAASFGVVIDATEQLASARTDIVYRMMEQEALLLEAQGRTADADKKRREILDKQRAAEYERLMKVNPELARLTAELWALEDAAVAAANAAALEREISDNRRDYTDRILQQEAELLDAQGRTAEADRKRRELLDRQRARENERLMALNPELARLAYELWLLEDATAAATRAAKERKEISNDLYNALVKAVDAEKTLLNEQKARLEETISTLKNVFEILKNSVAELYGEVSSTASMQANEGRSVIAQAISTGVLPDSKVLSDSIQAVRDEINNSLYVTKADADKARLIFAAQLSLLKDTTEEQLTDAERQLKAINTQISYLDNILKTAKEQLDAFLGNTEVLKSVSQALADLYAYLKNPEKPTPTDPVPMPKPVGTEKPGKGGSGSGGGAVFGPAPNTSKPATVNSDGNIVYADGSIGYRNSWVDKYGVKHYGFVSKEIWETERAKGTPGYPAYADGGYYQGGLALVGEEGPELINFSNPGQVYTAKQTANMLSGDSSEVVAELKTLRGEVIMLRAEVRADVSHNAKTAKLLDRVIPEGDSVKVTVS